MTKLWEKCSSYPSINAALWWCFHRYNIMQLSSHLLKLEVSLESVFIRKATTLVQLMVIYIRLVYMIYLEKNIFCSSCQSFLISNNKFEIEVSRIIFYVHVSPSKHVCILKSMRHLNANPALTRNPYWYSLFSAGCAAAVLFDRCCLLGWYSPTQTAYD